jgi:hypothetical protein
MQSLGYHLRSDKYVNIALFEISQYFLIRSGLVIVSESILAILACWNMARAMDSTLSVADSAVTDFR